MTTTREAVLLTTAAAIVFTALPACAAADAPSSPGPDWTACAGTGLDPRQRCATLDVPLDHDDPDGEQVELVVSRIPAADAGTRRGTLLLVPGGPGEPGLSDPTSAVQRLPPEVLDAYDLVGFDPRGVGRSSPVRCDLAHEDLSVTRLRPWPEPDGDIAANAAAARRTADACAANGGPLLAELTTANEARDIDRIRQALGEQRISLWGVSYGTYASAVYAQMFPDRTDRVLLDSVDDPDPTRVARGWLANYAVGVEDAFPDFAEWAADPGNPQRLADTSQDVRTLFLDLATRLDTDPIPWPGANPPVLSGNVLRQTLLDTLYSPTRYPALASVMHAALDRTAPPAPNTPPAEALQNTAAAAGATICNDVAWPTDLRSYARDVAASRKSHPLTAGMPVNVLPCAFWPHPPAEPPVEITPAGPSNVLLVQNLRDPSTPHSGALQMREALGERARMITVDATGHGSYVHNGNPCGDRHVTDFLLTGERPAEDTFCPA